MSFRARLQELVDEKSRGNAAEFARLCGIQDSSIRQYLKGTKPSLDNLMAISSASGVSMDWLAAGRGQKNYSGEENNNIGRDVSIARLQVAASAGFGAFNADPEFEAIRLPGAVLERIGIRPASARIITASGSSMEPTIGDGDLLLVDVSKDARTPVEGRIYVLTVGEALFVKRLRRSPSGWVMVSDNRALYPDEPIPAGVPVVIHGRVVWAGRKLG